jgi:hypothetical protein
MLNPRDMLHDMLVFCIIPGCLDILDGYRSLKTGNRTHDATAGTALLTGEATRAAGQKPTRSAKRLLQSITPRMNDVKEATICFTICYVSELVDTFTHFSLHRNLRIVSVVMRAHAPSVVRAQRLSKS